MDRRLYLHHIDEAERRGETVRFGREITDQWSHLSVPDCEAMIQTRGVQNDNTRLLTPLGVSIMQILQPDTVLNLGPGMGVETSMIADLSPGSNIDTLGLTPISPRVMWTPVWKGKAYYEPRFLRFLRGQIAARLKEDSGSAETALSNAKIIFDDRCIDIDRLFSLQRSTGIPVYRMMEEPMLRRQYIGNCWSKEADDVLTEQYEFIYGNNCPVVKRPFGEESTLPRIVKRLSSSGVLYCHHFGFKEACQQNVKREKMSTLDFSGIRIHMSGLVLVGEDCPELERFEQALRLHGNHVRGTNSWSVLPSRQPWFIDAFLTNSN